MRRLFKKCDVFVVGIILFANVLFGTFFYGSNSSDYSTNESLIDLIICIIYIIFIISLYLYRNYSFRRFWEFPVLGLVRLFFPFVEVLRSYGLISISEYFAFILRCRESVYLVVLLITTISMKEKVERT